MSWAYNFETQMETDADPAPGDWVLEIVEDIPGYTVYDVNNGVGRVIGYGPAIAAIRERNPEGRDIWLHDKDGNYRKWFED